MEGLTEGRIVHYVPSLEDAIRANNRRVLFAGHGPNWPAGAQAHVGNPVISGHHYAAIVVSVLPADYLDGTAVNLQVFLDGNDVLWITATNSQDPNQMGAWHWIERA